MSIDTPVDFHDFARAVHRRLDSLLSDKDQEVFRTDISKDDRWSIYQEAFPEGTNDIHRKRPVHDCSCCRSFMNNVGNLVVIRDGEVKSIWQDLGLPPDSTYGIVAQALDESMRAANIDRIFRAEESKYGQESNLEILEDGGSRRWHHFWAVLPKRLVSLTAGQDSSESMVSYNLLKRALNELRLASLELVVKLIESNSLYRGEEHKAAVVGFALLKAAYDEVEGAEAKDLFVWQHINHKGARFRNRAIGTLVVDLSEGMDLNKAVARFEKKVAPENYRRSSAPISKGMVEKALGTLRELGLEGAVHRRYAVIGDVSPADVLFVDRSVSPLMKDPLADLLMGSVTTKSKKVKGATKVSSAVFFDEILPGAESVEIFLERKHGPHFVSLTAPQEESTGRLFHWPNDFAWVYDGDITDSDMRKAVEAAGGRVDGVLRFSTSWNHPDRRNASLMDGHVFMPASPVKPDNGKHDNYGDPPNRQGKNGGHSKLPRVGWNNRKNTTSGGEQDVDYVTAAPVNHIPVENITFPDLAKMPSGRYICKVHNWRRRHPTTGGFKAEIEFGGQVFEYDYPKALDQKEWVTVAEVTLKDGRFTVKHHIKPKSSEIEKWGLQTGNLVPVDTIMLSPNYWGEQGQGNKHHIFILRGCKNPEKARGFFNEYLRSDLHQHRKVFEVLAGKLRVEPSDEQLSGVGFSSTSRATASFVVRKDGTSRTFDVQF